MKRLRLPLKATALMHEAAQPRARARLFAAAGLLLTEAGLGEEVRHD